MTVSLLGTLQSGYGICSMFTSSHLKMMINVCQSDSCHISTNLSRTRHTIKNSTTTKNWQGVVLFPLSSIPIAVPNLPSTGPIRTLKGNSVRSCWPYVEAVVVPWYPTEGLLCDILESLTFAQLLHFFFESSQSPALFFFGGGFQLWKMLGFTLRLCSVCYLIRIERFWRGSSVSNGILGAWMSGFVAQPFHFGGIAFALAIGTIWDYGIPCHPTVMAIIRRFGTSSLVCDKPQWRKLESWTCHTCQSCQSEILFQEVWRKKVRL